MLKILPIIPSSTFHPLFLFYTHIILLGLGNIMKNDIESYDFNILIQEHDIIVININTY